jgi:SAM-dependent methyltransferase
LETTVREYDWWAHFFRARHRPLIPGIAAWDERLIDYLVETLCLTPDSKVLDVACGSGVHLAALARRGIGGVGFDISKSLVGHATENAADVADLVSFREGDMRDIPSVIGDETFDAVLLLSGSFGFFDLPGDVEVLTGMANALEPGGRLLLDCVSPAWAQKPPARYWEKIGDGYLLSESHYDPASCVRQTGFLFIEDGVVSEMAEPERIRVYTLPELMGLLGAVGLSFVSAHGGHDLPPVPYGAEHAERLVVTAQRS